MLSVKKLFSNFYDEFYRVAMMSSLKLAMLLLVLMIKECHMGFCNHTLFELAI